MGGEFEDRIGVRLRKEEGDELRRRAAEGNTSISEVVRGLIARALIGEPVEHGEV